MNDNNEYCYLCGGHLSAQEVTKIQTERGTLVSVINKVPAWVCNQCGERYYDGIVLEQIEGLLNSSSVAKRNITVPAYEFSV